MTMLSTAATLATDSPPVRRAMARSALFRFFSLACGYPTAERFTTLRENALPAAQAAALIAARGLASHLAPLASRLEVTALEDLQSQYHAAFGHLPLPDCPSYESGYLGTSDFRQAHVMADVAGFYRAFGLRIGHRERERVDHVTAELEFMRFLTYKEAFARVHHGRAQADICRKAQRRFWREHLGQWLPAFALLLEQKTSAGVYGALALALTGFAEAESRALGKMAMSLDLSPQPQSFGDMDCSIGEDACPLNGAGTYVTP